MKRDIGDFGNGRMVLEITHDDTAAKIDAIVAVLKSRSQWLSDGFGYYLPARDWLPENDGLTYDEMKEKSLRKIAREILQALDNG